jgi:hypothetical protein
MQARPSSAQFRPRPEATRGKDNWQDEVLSGAKHKAVVDESSTEDEEELGKALEMVGQVGY